MNIPNLLTTLRFFMIPCFLISFRAEGECKLMSAAIFILASITDVLDGYIARKYNMTTKWGQLMDPLADKLLVTSALVCMVQTGVVPGWMVIVILAREFAITGLRSVAASEGVVIAAAWSGKIKTVTQMIAIIFLLIGNWPFELISVPFAQIMLWIAVIMTVYSGAEYIYKSRELFRSR